jgi:hypothetical protein
MLKTHLSFEAFIDFQPDTGDWQLIINALYDDQCFRTYTATVLNPFRLSVILTRFQRKCYDELAAKLDTENATVEWLQRVLPNFEDDVVP